MLKLNVGFTKKAGEANFGSRGASVNLYLELDGGLIGDPDRLKDRIRQLFRDGTRKATANQVRALHTIGARQRLDLAAVLHERFGIYDPAELSITEASE